MSDVNSPEALEAVAASLRQSAWLLEEMWSALRASQKIPEAAATQWVDTWWAAYCAQQYQTVEDDDER